MRSVVRQGKWLVLLIGVITLPWFGFAILAPVPAWQLAVSLAPRNAAFQLRLAEAFEREADSLAGFHDLALDLNFKAHNTYRKALDLGSNSAETYLGIGRTALGLGEIGEAIESLRHALQLRADLGDAHYYLGRAYNRQGSSEAAVNAYRAALSAEFQNSELHLSLGHSLHQMGHADLAAESFRCFLRRFPRSAEARAGLEQALLRSRGS